METWLSRTEMLLGEELEKLQRARVAVFGIGGVGGYAVEALARCGVGALDLFDHDTVSLTNLNRQIIATRNTVGRYKVDCAAERIASINPDCVVRTHKLFYLPEKSDQIDFPCYDYLVDAVDTLTAKLSIVENAVRCGVPVVSSMGTGNKLDPAKLKIGDIFETSVCPLARAMRRELRRRKIDHLKVVYSTEEPIPPKFGEDTTRRSTPGSISFVPGAAGLLLASVVVGDLIR